MDTRHSPLRAPRKTPEHVREYVHAIRNRVNAPIMRAALLREIARERRAHSVAVRMFAQHVRASLRVA